MGFKFLGEIATADIAFEADGETLSGLFIDSALALEDSMVDLKGIKKKEKKTIKLESNNVENLMYDWLSELIFLKDSEDLLFSKFDIEIKDNRLIAKCFGEKVDKDKHTLRNDVKAVTLHKFKVEKTDKWRASIILDI